MNKKFYRTTVELGVFNYKTLVVYTTSSQDAISQIKMNGYRFSLHGETVSDISDILNGYIKSKVSSGEWIMIGDKPWGW